MMGYLQRLSSSALNPGGTIHPILKPIYSSAFQTVPENFPEEVISPPLSRPEPHIKRAENPPPVAGSAPASPIPQTFRDAGMELPASISDITPAAERPSLPKRPELKTDPSLIAPERPPLTPLVRKPHYEPVQDDLRDSVSFGDRAIEARQAALDPARFQPEHATPQDRRPITDLPKTPPAAAAPVDLRPDRNRLPAAESAPVQGAPINARQLEEESPRIVSRDRFIPLVIQPTRQQPQSSLPVSAASPNIRKVVARPASASWKQPEREPDDIQIHIGRIEVTAVPLPQAPPAAKPERKAVSLDEYLKSRRGRT